MDQRIRLSSGVRRPTPALRGIPRLLSGLLGLDGTLSPVRQSALDQPRSVVPPRRTLIIGAGEAGRSLARELESHFPEQYAILGFVHDDPLARSEAERPILGRREEIAHLVRSHRIDTMIVSDFGVGELGGVCRRLGDDESREAGGDGRGDEEPPLDLVSLIHSPLGRAAKRGFDLAFSSIALVTVAPVAALAALAIKLTSPGPVFYSQKRIGLGGRPFTIYKLRTMVDGAESKTGPVLSRRGDPRSTPLGRILRATKLDEWPQFYNVLRGEMSVVGPRPERECFVQTYRGLVPGYAMRHAIRPGITGLAQVKGGYLTHVYVKLHYDLLYVYNQSLWLDLWIVARTPAAILANLIRKR